MTLTMNERMQKITWTLLAAVAIALAAATVHLYQRSRTLSTASELPGGRIAYMHFAESSSIPQLFTYDLQSGDVQPLIWSRAGDVLPVSAPPQAAQRRPPRVAFLRFTSDPSSSTETQLGAPGGVYVVNSDGSQERKVSGAVPRMLPVAPAWSPDGEQLAFAGVQDLNSDGQYTAEEAGIYLCDVDSADVKRVTAVHAIGTRLQWSPTSPQLILQAQMAEAPVPVAHLLDLHTGELVLRDLATTLGCWSPDGQYIAAYSTVERKIHILNTAGEELWAVDVESERELLDMFWLPASSTAEDYGRFLTLTAPAHSSDVARLSLSSALTGQPVTWKHVTDDDTHVVSVTLAPDGQWAVFSRGRMEGTGMEADLYLLDLIRAQTRQLTQEPGYESWPTWIPARS